MPLTEWEKYSNPLIRHPTAVVLVAVVLVALNPSESSPVGKSVMAVTGGDPTVMDV